MATITTDTFLDGGTARTAGESWTIQNCELTIRTDTRVHANAPASMTGSLGALTITTALGGAVRIVGSNVRWLTFDTGLGVVPAIGSNITQGGVTGYLLGIWPDLTSSPVAVGATTPSSGYIKLREVSGAFTSGAIIGTAFTANATSADVTGWIEVVTDASTNWTLSSLGDGFVITGNWFYLDNTTGSVGQILQVPTNGGGSGTSVNAVQIETSPGSNVYEWYNGISTGWTNAILTTDARAKFVQCLTNGQVRIGSDGTNNIGFTPVAGCKVRVPNVFLRNCATGTRATNAAVTSTTSIRTTINTGAGGGIVNWQYAHSSWFSQFATPTNVSLANCAVESALIFSGVIETANLNNCANGNPSGLSQTTSFARTSGCSMANCKIMNIGSLPLQFNTFNTNFTLTDTILAQVLAKAGSTSCLTIGALINSTFTNLTLLGGRVTANAGSSNLVFTGTDYVDRLSGDTAATQATNVFDVTSSTGPITINGFTFGLRGVLANTHTYGVLFATGGCVGPVKIRNIGTAAAPLNCGNNATTYPSNLHTSVSFPDNFEIKRCYIANARLSAFSMLQGSSGTGENCIVSNSGALRSQNFTAYGRNLKMFGVWGTNNFSNGFQNTDTFWMDSFTSSTAGQLSLSFNKAERYSSYITQSISTAAKSGFDNSGNLRLKTAGDFVIIDTPDRIYGHTALQNVAPTMQGTNPTTKHTWEYQIDTGSGYGGTWKTITAANLSAETIDPVIGIKIKVKVTCSVSDNTNAIFQLRILTTSTQSAQENALYPLDTNTLTFTNLIAGSEVRCYTGSDPATAVEIGGVESSGTSFSFTHSSGGVLGYIRIFALGYQPFNYDPYTYSASDTSLLVQQVVDRNYVNP